MNSSFHNLDRATHLKILAVAAAMAALVLLVGKCAPTAQSVSNLLSAERHQAFPATMSGSPESERTGLAGGEQKTS